MIKQTVYFHQADGARCIFRQYSRAAVTLTCCFCWIINKMWTKKRHSLLKSNTFKISIKNMNILTVKSFCCFKFF